MNEYQDTKKRRQDGQLIEWRPHSSAVFSDWPACKFFLAPCFLQLKLTGQQRMQKMISGAWRDLGSRNATTIGFVNAMMMMMMMMMKLPYFSMR